MADKNSNLQPGPENKKDLETPEVKYEKTEVREKELEKAKVSVAIEGLEGLEEAEGELTTGEVSEKTQKTKDKYTDKGSGATIAATTKTQFKPLPSVPVMKAQVKTELKNEIKQLHKKIRKVMKESGNFEAHEVNVLMAQLRKLTDLLKSLADATTDFIKDLWMRYIKEKRA